MTEKVKKIPTGIKGFDEMLEGGLPQNRLIVLSGYAGTGKTVFLNEFLYRGIRDYDQNGVLVTFEEYPEDIKKNVAGFGWDYDKLEKEDKLKFVNMSQNISGETVIIEGDMDMSPIIKRILYAVDKVKAKRVVIDGIDALFSRFKDKEVIRDTIFRISRELKEKEVTALMAMESSGNESGLSRYGVEEFVADGAIELKMEEGELSFIRKLFVRKLRGCGYRSGIVEYDIDNNGLRVFPREVMDSKVARTDFNKRLKTGIEDLDEAMTGGIPQGHTVLVSGNSGTGKTLFGLQFLMEGINNKEKVLMVSLEESQDQIKKTALEHGWDLEQMEKENRFFYHSASLIDTRPDKLVNDIKEIIKDTGATRLLIDSVSSLESAAMNESDVRMFLIQLNSFLKFQGVTAILNYLSSANFGAGGGSLLSALETNTLRLSSITDGIIIMLYVEKKEKVGRIINILKMRGIQHDKSIREYKIVRGGIELSEK